MERYCSTGQSPQRAVAPTEEEEEEEEEEGGGAVEWRNVKKIEFSGFIYFRLGTIVGTYENSSLRLFTAKYEVLSEEKGALFHGFV
jgi:hypothetical protein